MKLTTFPIHLAHRLRLHSVVLFRLCVLVYIVLCVTSKCILRRFKIAFMSYGYIFGANRTLEDSNSVEDNRFMLNAHI